MTWRQVTMVAALAHYKTRQIAVGATAPLPILPSGEAGREILRFSDGTALAVESRYAGPYSEVTPDVEMLPPDWWVYS